MFPSRRIVSSSQSPAGLCSATWHWVLVCEEPAYCASQMHGWNNDTSSLGGSCRRGNRSGIVHCKFTCPSAQLRRSLPSLSIVLVRAASNRQVLQSYTRSYIPGAGDDLRKSDIPYEQNLRRHHLLSFEGLHCLRTASLRFRWKYAPWPPPRIC